MMAALSFLLAVTGFACLALSMAKHWRDLFGRPPVRLREHGWRLAGWLLLAASLAASIGAVGLLIGIILWAGLLTLAALTVALLLTYKDKWWRA